MIPFFKKDKNERNMTITPSFKKKDMSDLFKLLKKDMINVEVEVKINRENHVNISYIHVLSYRGKKLFSHLQFVSYDVKNVYSLYVDNKWIEIPDESRDLCNSIEYIFHEYNKDQEEIKRKKEEQRKREEQEKARHLTDKFLEQISDVFEAKQDGELSLNDIPIDGSLSLVNE